MKASVATCIAVTCLTLAACGNRGAAPHAAPDPRAAVTAASGTHSAPAASTATPVSAPASPSGPFKITPLYCGTFSKSQQNQYDDTSGLIFKYTNTSNSLTGAPDLRVNFVEGSTVTGDNMNGAIPDIGPGQSAYGDVGAVGTSGQSLKFESCELIGYSVGYGGTQFPVQMTLSAQAAK